MCALTWNANEADPLSFPRVRADRLDAGACRGGTRLETELVARCSSIDLGPTRAGEIRLLLRQRIHWPYVLETALRHSVMPLLYHTLHTTYPGAVPSAALAQLRYRFQANAIRNVVLTEELIRLVQLFEAEGITALPFKGPVLASSIYGSLSLRQFGDLDILVRSEHYLRSSELLISQGYQRDQGSFVRWGGRINVDLQHRLTPAIFSCPFHIEHLWSRAQRVSLAGTTVLTLAPEDLLLYLCVHGAKHCWERMVWVRDIAGLIHTHRTMDWGAILDESKRLRVERLLFIALFLANDLLGAQLPGEVWRRMRRHSAARWLAIQVSKWLLSDTLPGPKLVVRPLFRIMARECVRDKAQYVRCCSRFAMRHAIRRLLGVAR